MRIPDDTPLEISEGIWNLFVDPEAVESRDHLPLYAEGMELLQRHRQSAERDPRAEWHSQFRVGIEGRRVVVILRTTWWPEPREKGTGFLGPTARFVVSTATGPGLLTFMCLEEEWEALVGDRPHLKPWPREN
jgi:hypothetical protein